MSKYAEFWRRERERRGLSQAEWAHVIGVQAQYVSNVERGMCRFSLSHLQKLVQDRKVNLKAAVNVVMEEEEARLREKFMGRR